MIITRTPFRISFFGGGTDHYNWFLKHGGAVLSTSINKYCYITCRHRPPFFADNVRVVWSKVEAVKHADQVEHPTARESLKFLGFPQNISVQYDADLPARSGMGSSSAFTVGLLHALYALKGQMVTKHKLALDAMHVEQELVKENIGCQDQPAASFGGFNKITFGGPEKIHLEPVLLPARKLEALQNRLMLFFTGVARNSSEVAADWIRNTERNSQDLRRMMAMVDEALEILNAPDAELDEFGRLLHDAWQMKRGLAESISNSHIDEIYAAARAAGAVGGKILGAGGGGFILFYVPPEKQAAVRTELQNLIHVPFRFENLGSQIIYYGPKHNLPETSEAEPVPEVIQSAGQSNES